MLRRDFIKHSIAVMGAAAFGRYGFYPPRPVLADTINNQFTSKLFIPPLLESAGTDQHGQPFSLVVQKRQHDFLPGKATETLGYNGSFLGPTVRVRDGEQVRFNVENTIDQETTVHWHGLHVPAEWDGGPHQVIKPGETWKPEFTINQQAATLWYHPHAMGLTGEHVYRGLAGLFIIVLGRYYHLGDFLTGVHEPDALSQILFYPFFIPRIGMDDKPLLLVFLYQLPHPDKNSGKGANRISVWHSAVRCPKPDPTGPRRPCPPTA